MFGDNPEKFKIEYVEVGRVDLRDLDLLEHRLTQDTDGNSPHAREHGGKELEYQETHFNLPQELNEQERESFVNYRGVLVPCSRKLFHQAEEDFQRDNDQGLALVSTGPFEHVKHRVSNGGEVVGQEITFVEPDLGDKHKTRCPIVNGNFALTLSDPDAGCDPVVEDTTVFEYGLSNASIECSDE